MSCGENDFFELLKQEDVFDELVDERRFVTNKLSEDIDSLSRQKCSKIFYPL